MALEPEVSRLRYRSRSVNQLDLRDGRRLLYCMSDGSKHIVARHTSAILERCGSFAEIDSHARNICVQLGYAPGQVSAVLKDLNELIVVGLLVSDADLLSDTKPPCQLKQSDFTGRALGIVTSGRPECLGRCLQSYSANVRRHGWDILFYVVDDSEHPQTQAQNREVVLRSRREMSTEIAYFGAEHRARLQNDLSAKGLDPDIVKFAISNPTKVAIATGGNRNTLLLLTLGKSLISVDDDSVCSLACAHPKDMSSVALSSAYNPVTVSFYSSRQKLLESIPFEEADFIGTHTRALGRTTREFCRQFHSIANAGAISNNLMHTLEKGDGTVLVSQNGIAGDCGFGSPSGYLTAGGRTRAQLLQSELTYNSACTSREIVGMAERFTLSDSPFLMSGSLGLDNRAGLAPFFPVYRGQDAIFGCLVRKCFARSISCHVPIAVFHAPPVQRHFDRDAIWRDAGRMALSSLILLMVNSAPVVDWVENPSTALHVVGSYLLDLSRMSDAGFWDSLYQMGLLRVSEQIAAMEELRCNNRNAPRYFVQDLHRYIECLRLYILSERFLLPLEFWDSFTPHEAHRLVKKLAGQYGALLKAWPQIIEVAKTLDTASDL